MTQNIISQLPIENHSLLQDDDGRTGTSDSPFTDTPNL